MPAVSITALVQRQCSVHRGARVASWDVAFAADHAAQERVTTMTVDISDENAVRDACARVVEMHGGIDVLVCNAAVFVFGTVEEASGADWDRAFNVNVKGTAFCIKHALPALRVSAAAHPERGAAIVNLSSISVRCERRMPIALAVFTDNFFVFASVCTGIYRSSCRDAGALLSLFLFFLLVLETVYS